MIKKTTIIPASSKFVVTKSIRLSLPIESRAKYLNLVLGDKRDTLAQYDLPNQLDKLDGAISALKWNTNGIINQIGIHLGEFMCVHANEQLVDVELKSLLNLFTSLVEIFQINTTKCYSIEDKFVNPETLLYQTSLLVETLRTENIGKATKVDKSYIEFESLDTFRYTKNYKFVVKYISFLASFIASYTRLDWEVMFKEIIKYETPPKVKQKDSSNAYKEK